ncbi:hypothetical protein LA080_003111 [Diaporthe eres]|uniref:Peptidase S9 prolyl oligopeptidase catalytic domain-containing protein n=1 Tax=Diaporthe vaccinii TaxID=105482 RepID=A0ABR4DTX6_9PEZI|nr:hypothetical protein LA080_003111 [Diaporthe eres]
MVVKTIAPYGSWESPFSVDDATAGSKSLSSPRGDIRTGRVFFLESKADGSNTIVEVVTATGPGAPGLAYVLPEPHGVSTGVYEYGGGAYEVLPARGGDGAASCSSSSSQDVIFSDASDGNAVKVLSVDVGAVRTLVEGTPWLRYSEFAACGASRWVLAVQEDHSLPEPKDVKNYVVAIDLVSGEVRRLVEGADFYSSPKYSPDGKWVSFRSWDHPDMPWQSSALRWAQVLGDAKDDALSLGAVSTVAGGEPGQAVGESAWGLDGALYWTQEVEGSDWRQLWRQWPGDGRAAEALKLKGLEEVEIGDCSMLMGCHTYGFLSSKSMILSYTKYATNSTVHVELETLEVTPLTGVPLTAFRGDTLHAITPTSFLIIGSGTVYPSGVYHFSLSETLEVDMTQVHTADDKKIPANTVSVPEHMWLKATRQDPKRPVHGFYWPPHNPRFTAPEGELPPLLINPHGGPTGHTPPGLKVGGVGGGNAQFWTSRGFAYFSINYTGSSGHGRSYRERLDGEWGILDRDDVVEIVRHLCETGRADKTRVGIHGGSAGGYAVLQSLVWYPDVFAAGVCYCGVSDMKALGEGTHKLESHYLNGLLYKPGMSEKEREAVEYERSPVRHAERIRAPLLLLHGDKDTVVPIEQSYEIERKVRERGGDVKMVVAPGDGHMFLMEKSKKLALQAEVEWWMRTLVRK